MVKSDVGAVATLLSKVMDFFNFRQRNKEVRDLKAAAVKQQMLNNRVWKLSKTVREDKTCNKYRKYIDRKII